MSKGGGFRRLGALITAAVALGGFSPRQQAEVRVNTQSQQEKSGGGVPLQAPAAPVLDMRRVMERFGGQSRYQRPGFIWNARSHPGRSGGKRTRHDYRR